MRSRTLRAPSAHPSIWRLSATAGKMPVSRTSFGERGRTKWLNENRSTSTASRSRSPSTTPTCRCSMRCATISRLHGPRFGCGLGAMRRLHRACRRQGGALLRRRRCRRVNARQKVVTLEGLGTPQQAAPGAAGLHRGAGRPVRLLHQRHDHGVGRLPRQATRSRARPQIKQALANNLCRCGTHARIVRAVKRAATSREGEGDHESSMASRRDMLKGGGALVVSFSFAGAIGDALAQGAAAAKPLALNEVELVPRHRPQGHGDRSIPARSISAPASRRRCAQIVAEELDVPLSHDQPGARRHARSRPTRARPGAALPSRSAACRCATRRRPRAARCSTRPPSASA